MCWWGRTNYRVFIWNNMSMTVNAMLLLKEAEKPKGIISKRSRTWSFTIDERTRLTGVQLLTNESQAPTQLQRTPSPLPPLCFRPATPPALGPGLGYFSARPSTCTRIFKGKKNNRELLKHDGFHFTLLRGISLEANATDRLPPRNEVFKLQHISLCSGRLLGSWHYSLRETPEAK